jgi:hypothetical protein
MRRLLTLAAATTVYAAVAAGAAQAQTAGRLLSWPGKTAPAPVDAIQPATPSPFVAQSGRPAAMGPRVENRYSPRSSAPRQMARAEAPTPIYPPVFTPVPAPVYVPAPAYTPAPPPAPVARPNMAPVPSRSPASIFDPVIPDRGFEPAPSAVAAPAPAPVSAPLPAPPRATATPLAPPVAGSMVSAPAPAASPNGPRFYSVHREFGAVPDRAPHPAVARGATADPLPSAFFNSNAAPEDDEVVDERPIERKAPEKPKRRSAKR